jgi:hypothetical protein
MLAENHFSGSLPNDIGKLTSLEKLDLRSNDITGTIPAAISKLSSLMELSLYDVKISGPIPNEIKTGLRKLRTLKISSSGLSGGIPPGLTKNMPRLRELHLWGQISGPLSRSLTAGGKGHLDHVYVHGTGKPPLTPAVNSGRLQSSGNGATRARLATSSEPFDHVYNGLLLSFSTGPGAGQTRGIINYDGHTRIVEWQGDLTPVLLEGRLDPSGSDATHAKLRGASPRDGHYDGMTISFVAGTGAGQSKTVASYVGSTRTAAWQSDPNVTAGDSTTLYQLIGKLGNETEYFLVDEPHQLCKGVYGVCIVQGVHG